LNENADENERISLRLGPEELRMIDDFLAESNDFSNRSQLARAAIKSFIEKGNGGNEERLPNEVLVVLPPLVLETIKHLIEQGIYRSGSGLHKTRIPEQGIPGGAQEERKPGEKARYAGSAKRLIAPVVHSP